LPRNRRTVPLQQRRQELTAVAATAFSEHGYAGTTIAGIARRAGVAANAVRWYFPHKDDALAAVVNHLLDSHFPDRQGDSVDGFVASLTELAVFRRLAPAVAEREDHSAAVAGAARRVHVFVEEAVDHLVGDEVDPLDRRAVVSIATSQLTDPLAVMEPEILRHVIHRLLG
jgi:TetR/AcrR family transcriptional regulator, repressor of the mexAB-oprM multidrug resistance operon